MQLAYASGSAQHSAICSCTIPSGGCYSLTGAHLTAGPVVERQQGWCHDIADCQMLQAYALWINLQTDAAFSAFSIPVSVCKLVADTPQPGSTLCRLNTCRSLERSESRAAWRACHAWGGEQLSSTTSPRRAQQQRSCMSRTSRAAHKANARSIPAPCFKAPHPESPAHTSSGLPDYAGPGPAGLPGSAWRAS